MNGRERWKMERRSVEGRNVEGKEGDEGGRNERKKVKCKKNGTQRTVKRMHSRPYGLMDRWMEGWMVMVK